MVGTSAGSARRNPKPRGTRGGRGGGDFARRHRVCHRPVAKPGGSLRRGKPSYKEDRQVCGRSNAVIKAWDGGG